MNILIVEDEKSVRRMLKQMVEGLGIFNSVRTACELDQARNILNDQDSLDGWVILSDIRLNPDLGIDLCDEFPELPFIFMSGRFSEDEGKRAKKAAWNNTLLGKPFSREDLEQVLQELVDYMESGDQQAVSDS